jgi:hypothetical protein
MPFPAIPIITEVVSIAKGWLSAHQQRKQAKLNSELKLEEARADAMIELMKNQQAADVAWETLSIQRNGWKDEWFTVLLSIPMVLCFVPGGAQYVKAGFDALQASTPEWYQWAFLIAVGSAFGIRKFADLMQLKKGV